MSRITRREFVMQTAAAGTLLSLGMHKSLKAESPNIKIGVFSKHLQWLNYQNTADVVAEGGWDGIECPVRPGGHVLPERVKDDLPAMVNALRENGLDMLMAATGFNNVNAPHAMDVLQTMSEQGVRLYRPNWFKYDKNTPVIEQLGKIKPLLQEMTNVNAELGLCTAYQNHSGREYVGGPIWDFYGLIKDLDPEHMGMAFDIGHATVEGGNTWAINARLVSSRMKCVIIKDFKWEKGPQGRWQCNWGPLGSGMINRDFMTMLQVTGFNGPIIQHFEWEVKGRTKAEAHKNSIKAMNKDCQTLVSWLVDSGLR